MSEISESFLNGFTEKCAEHRIDPALLVKAAAEIKSAQGLFSADTMKQVFGFGKDPSKPSVHPEVAARYAAKKGKPHPTVKGKPIKKRQSQTAGGNKM